MLGIVAFFMSQIWNVILWDIKYNHHTLAEAGAQITWKGSNAKLRNIKWCSKFSISYTNLYCYSI